LKITDAWLSTHFENPMSFTIIGKKQKKLKTNKVIYLFAFVNLKAQWEVIPKTFPQAFEWTKV
jgi:hypothetical protein